MNVISTEKAPGAIGPYSQGFEVNGVIYTSGQIPVNPADGSVQDRHGKRAPGDSQDRLSRAARTLAPS